VDKFSNVSHSIISGLTMPSCSHKCGLTTKIFHFRRGSSNYESPCRCQEGLHRDVAKRDSSSQDFLNDERFRSDL